MNEKFTRLKYIKNIVFIRFSLKKKKIYNRFF